MQPQDLKLLGTFPSQYLRCNGLVKGQITWDETPPLKLKFIRQRKNTNSTTLLLIVFSLKGYIQRQDSSPHENYLAELLNVKINRHETAFFFFWNELSQDNEQTAVLSMSL